MTRKVDWTPENRKGFTPAQRLTLAKLDNRILRAFPASPYQHGLREERDRLESEYATLRDSPQRDRIEPS